MFCHKTLRHSYCTGSPSPGVMADCSALVTSYPSAPRRKLAIHCVSESVAGPPKSGQCAGGLWGYVRVIVIYICPAACGPGGSWQLEVFPRLVYPSSCPHPALLRKAMRCHIAVRVGPPFLLPRLPHLLESGTKQKRPNRTDTQREVKRGKGEAEAVQNPPQLRTTLLR